MSNPIDVVANPLTTAGTLTEPAQATSQATQMAGLTREECESRLRQAARIIVNGAIRAAQCRAGGDKPL